MHHTRQHFFFWNWSLKNCNERFFLGKFSNLYRVGIQKIPTFFPFNFVRVRHLLHLHVKINNLCGISNVNIACWLQIWKKDYFEYPRPQNFYKSSCGAKYQNRGAQVSDSHTHTCRKSLKPQLRSPNCSCGWSLSNGSIILPIHPDILSLNMSRKGKRTHKQGFQS